MGANNRGAGEFYMIKVELTAGAGATTSTTPVKQVGSWPFEWRQLGATWGTNGDWDVKISEAGGANRYFSSDMIPVAGLVGVDKQPYQLEHPWMFNGSSAINVEAKNNGAGSDTLKLVFVGRRFPSQ